MNYERITMGRLAKEQGFVRDTLEKVCRLTDILLFIQQDEYLHGRLALKGGTAINLTVFDLPRLSVDIDLDYTSHISRDHMLDESRQISDRLSKYMKAAGYTESLKSKKYHALDSFVYEYQNAGGMRDNLKIEINYMLRTHVLELQERPLLGFWLQSSSEVVTVNPIEIYGSKIVALINRNAPRDLYDVVSMIRANLIPDSKENILRKCVVFYGAIGSGTTPLDFTADEIANANPMRIKTDLIPVLRHGEHFDVALAEKTVKEYLRHLLNLTEQEKQFLLSFSEKRYQPELLFDDDSILERIVDHPMAIWKCTAKEAQPPVRNPER